MSILQPISAKVRIKEHLRQCIAQQWPPGTRLPPLRSLAAQLKIGERNVFVAVQELVQEGILESSPRRGTTVSNRAGRLRGRSNVDQEGHDAQSLVGKTIKLVASLPPSDSFIFEIIEGFAQVIEEAGGDTQTISVGGEPAFWRGPSVDLSPFGGDAVCLITHTPEVVLKFDPRQKLILISTVPEMWVDQAGGYDLVSVDHRQGAYLAGQRLRELGCHDVSYIGVRPSPRKQGLYDFASTDRLDSMERGLGRDIPDDRRLIAMHYSYIAGGELVPQFLALHPRPQGVFAASDELAIGFIIGMAAHGLRAGVDYQIIGFDGQVAGRGLLAGPLTSIDVHPLLMGRNGARLLIERFHQPDLQPRRVLLGCSLIEGVTANPIAAHQSSTTSR